MSRKQLHTTDIIWIVLMLLTLFSYTVGKLGLSGELAVFLLLLVSLIKGIFIIRDFMGLRGVSLIWRILMYGWLWTVISVIAITYSISL